MSMSMDGPVGGVPKHSHSLGVGEKLAGSDTPENEGSFKGRSVRRDTNAKKHTPADPDQRPNKRLHERTGSQIPGDVQRFNDPQPDSFLSENGSYDSDEGFEEFEESLPAGSNEELMRQLGDVEDKRRQSASKAESLDDNASGDEGIGMEEDTPPGPQPSLPPNPAPQKTAPPKLKVTTSSSEQASLDDPEKARKQKKMDKFFAGKMGFLDKHKKSIIATVVGGVLVAAGAGAAIGFAPAGICLYAVGIMLVTQGVAHMLNDGPDGAPPEERKKEDKPKTEDDEKKSKEKEKGGQGQYMLVDNPSYKGPDSQSQVDYRGDQTTADAIDPAQVGKNLPQLAANPNPTSAEITDQTRDILTEVGGLFGASSESNISPLVEKILAKLAIDAGINPEDTEAMARISNAINEVRSIVEEGMPPEEAAKAVIGLVTNIIHQAKPDADASQMLLKALNDLELDMFKGDPALYKSAKTVTDMLKALLEHTQAEKNAGSSGGHGAESAAVTGQIKAHGDAESLKTEPSEQQEGSATSGITPATFEQLTTSVSTGKYLALELELRKELSKVDRWEREEVKQSIMGCAAAVLKSEEELRNSQQKVPPFFPELLEAVAGLNRETSAGTGYQTLIERVQASAKTNNFLR